MFLVFDIGGTMTKYGLFQTTLIHEGAFPSLAQEGGMKLVERLCQEADALFNRYDIRGIAISTAGQIDSVLGKVVFATDNIPGYTGMNLKRIFEETYKVPVAVENDVNCFLLGELKQRCIEEDTLAITLGTGIGGAIYANGTVLNGSSFSAGEVGHIQIYKDGKPCTCGSKGCFEQYASTKALHQLVSTQLGVEDLISFFEMCKNGDVKSLSVFDQWLDDLTDGLKNLIHVLNPSKVIIGGAIAKQGQFLEDSMINALRNKVMPSFMKHLEIIVSPHGNTSNLLGALSHFLHCYPNLEV